MSIDRINAWVLKRLGRNARPGEIALSGAGLGLSIDDEQLDVPWPEVRRVEAFQRPSLAGDSIALEFELADDRVIEVDSEWSHWDSLTRDLPVYLRGARAYEQWLPELIASEPDRFIMVYRR